VEEIILADKNIKVPLFQTKSVLRDTFGENLPKSILNAPKKVLMFPYQNGSKTTLLIKS